MLSPTSRILTYLTAALALVTGLPLFFAPETFAPVFAWSVTPFMVMTIGAWCLGLAWLAFWAARVWEWKHIYPAAIQLWLFGLLEIAVVIAFRAKLVLAHPIAWLYLVTLGAILLATIVSVIDWLRLRPAIQPVRERTSAVVAALNLSFFLFVIFLGIYGFTVQIGGVGTNGGIFPELMSPFTLRSFAAFYTSLAMPALFLLINRDMDAMLFFSVAAYMLIVIITAAALAYFHLFDFAGKPGGIAYFSAYILVGIVIAIIVYLHRRRVLEILRPA